MVDQWNQLTDRFEGQECFPWESVKVGRSVSWNENSTQVDAEGFFERRWGSVDLHQILYFISVAYYFALILESGSADGYRLVANRYFKIRPILLCQADSGNPLWNMIRMQFHD